MSYTEVGDFFLQVLYGKQQEVTTSIMLARALLVYIFSFIILSWYKRFLGFGSNLDIVLRIVIGSLLASAIGGSFPFIPSLVTVVGMVTLSWLLGMMTWYFSDVEKYVKGSATILYDDDEFHGKAMRRNVVTRKDIYKALREQMHVNTLNDISMVLFENSGKISFVKRKPLKNINKLEKPV